MPGESTTPKWRVATPLHSAAGSNCRPPRVSLPKASSSVAIDCPAVTGFPSSVSVPAVAAGSDAMTTAPSASGWPSMSANGKSAAASARAVSSATVRSKSADVGASLTGSTTR